MAGAGYKLFNTGDVLTAQQVNEYLMQQTVMVFADASARTTALSGVLAEGMLSYLKSTDSTEVYNGSAWVALAADQTPLTTKGDLFTYTTADARLASSNVNGDVLTVDTSTASGLKWAAPSGFSWTSAASASFPTNTNTVTISSLSGKSYLIVIDGVTFAGNDLIALRFNSDTGENYRNLNSGATSTIKMNNTETISTPHYYCAYIPQASTTVALKSVIPVGTPSSASPVGGTWKNTSAITSITLMSFGQQNFAGGTYQIWSVQ